MTTPPPKEPDSPDPRYDEPDIDPPPDRMPETDYDPGGDDSRAGLRIRVENLLLSRERASAEAWAELGEPAEGLLVDMVRDWSVRSRDAVFHRVLAVLGDLRVVRGVPALAEVLQDAQEAPVARAYAASSLGRIGGRTAVDALLPAVPAADDMVRRQVATALGRIDDDAVLPHLLQLRADPSVAVSEVADRALRQWEERLGSQLGPDRPTPEPSPTTPSPTTQAGPVRPAREEG